MKKNGEKLAEVIDMVEYKLVKLIRLCEETDKLLDESMAMFDELFPNS